jgi:MFS family permease
MPATLQGRGGPPSSALRWVLTATGIGTALVWFDFALFGTVSALVFPTLFFPTLSRLAGLLATFLTFGVGLLARPIGAVFFGNLGDRYGRKRMLVISLSLMGFASLAIGLLPGYATIGVAAPILLVLLRCAQGFSLGGESSAATVLALEYAPPARRGITVASVNVGSPAGQVAVTGTLLAVRALAGEDAFIAWAWRIPFLIGFLLAILGYFIRRTVEETPVYRNAAARVRTMPALPLATVARCYPRTTLLLMPLSASSAALFYVCSVYSLSYFADTLHLPASVGFSLLLVTNLAALPLLLGAGWLGDRVGRKPVLYGGIGVSLVGTLLFFPLIDTAAWPLMLLAFLLTMGAQHAAGASRAVVLAESFPTEVRYTGHATAFTVGHMLGGSPTPFVATALLHWTGTPWSIAALLAAAIALSLAVLPFIRETVAIDIAGSYEASPATARE